jgi:hypothetical protein
VDDAGLRETLSWLDCHVHGFRLGPLQVEEGAAELEFDIDFIVEWLPQDDRSTLFRVAPATLTFHAASDLRVTLDYAAPSAGMTPFSIDGIERESLVYSSGYRSFV